MEINSLSAICTKCGTAFSRRKGYFPVSYAILHKGIGHIPICRDCIDSMYNSYLSQCNNAADAVRQMCRKLDLYWHEDIFRNVECKSTTRSMMTQYIAKTTSIKYAGKSYDDTLSEEGSLWNFGQTLGQEDVLSLEDDVQNSSGDADDTQEVSEDIIAFWGSGYTPAMYEELERRRLYWMSRLPQDIEIDIGTEVIIKQICSLEMDINRALAAGRAVDKSINALNSLLGSGNFKPTQKKEDTDANMDTTPFGVWIRKWENQRPIPEPDPELKDVDGIIKYIDIWFRGHLAKMLNIKNSYSKLYEDEMAKIRVDHPEYEDEDDETLFNDIFGNTPSISDGDE